MGQNNDKEEKKDKVQMIELQDLHDLIRLVMNTMTQLILQVDIGGDHLYYVQVGGILGSSHIYFIKRDELIKEPFIVYNKTDDTISFKKKLEMYGNLAYIPIIRIKNQSIITSDLLNELWGKT